MPTPSNRLRRRFSHCINGRLRRSICLCRERRIQRATFIKDRALAVEVIAADGLKVLENAPIELPVIGHAERVHVERRFFTTNSPGAIADHRLSE